MNFKFFLKKLAVVTLDILFPPICISCQTTLMQNEKRRHCCNHCFASITIASGFSCPICGARIPTSSWRCHDEAPYTLAAATQFSDAPVRALIHSLKYDHARRAATPLAELLVAHLRALQLDCSRAMLVPIPLHHERERKRGFNQAELIARAVGETLHVPVVTNALKRIRHTDPQATIGLSRNKKSSRETNVSGCFAVVDFSALRDRRIILVDDVTTSGATLREATRALRTAGARNVIALVVARAR